MARVKDDTFYREHIEAQERRIAELKAEIALMQSERYDALTIARKEFEHAEECLVKRERNIELERARLQVSAAEDKAKAIFELATAFAKGRD